MASTKTLVPTGLGLNCERETSHACLASGASQVELVHTLELLSKPQDLLQYGLIVFMGGFLDGDHLGSARVNVNRFKFGATWDLQTALRDYLAAGRLILGICNGFQFLVKLGLLPFEEEAFQTQSVSLTQNANNRFEDRWVHLKVNPACPTPFLQSIETLYLPIRHGEGRIVLKNEEVGQKLWAQQQVALQYADAQGNPTGDYPQNPNGSWNHVAGLCSAQGRVFGLMPHPEAFHHRTNHPHWTRLQGQPEEGAGLAIFKNAYTHLSRLA